MNKILAATTACLFSIVTLAGCGGGGGGGNGGGIPTATTKVHLFGTMSSASANRSAGVVDSVQTTTLAVPPNLFVNYTSQAVAGDPPNSYRLKGGFVVPSGPAQISVAAISGNYNTDTRLLTISFLNSGGVINLLSSTTANAGNGEELATINFTRTAGATPALSPDASPTIYQYRTISGSPSVDKLNGCSLKFTTTYQ